MKVYLTDDNDNPLALSNQFNKVPIFKAELEDCQIGDMEKVINKYSKYYKWTLNIESFYRVVFESSDYCGNKHYLVIKKGVK